MSKKKIVIPSVFVTLLAILLIMFGIDYKPKQKDVRKVEEVRKLS